MEGDPRALYKRSQLFVFTAERDELAQGPREPTGLPKPEAVGPDDEQSQSDCAQQAAGLGRQLPAACDIQRFP
jgi:hypothetical protein